MINASWDEQAQEIVVKHYVHLGSAVLRDLGAMLEDPMRMLAWS